jgi:hypothetical protein
VTVDSDSDRCAICAYMVTSGEAMEEFKDGGMTHTRPVRSLERALWARAEGHRVIHRSYNTPLPLYAETVVGGTLVCGPHVAYVIRL